MVGLWAWHQLPESFAPPFSSYYFSSRDIQLLMADGQLSMHWTTTTNNHDSAEISVHIFGFNYIRFNDKMDWIPSGDEKHRRLYRMEVPDCFPALFFAIPPLLWYRKYRANQRISIGLCRTCGYDLRATPNQCPECGTVPKSPDNPT
jgi:hypothetical protein